MKDKILIIGQAPPYQNQDVPYDTTMLYEWLEEVGISKEKAQNIFYFDAVYDKFPGFSKSGSHLRPTEEQMEDYWRRELRGRVDECKSILVLGACARDFLLKKKIDKPVEFIVHPSNRNRSIYIRRKIEILTKINNLIKL